MSKRDYCHTISQQYNCLRCLLIDLEQANAKIKELEAELSDCQEKQHNLNEYKDFEIKKRQDKLVEILEYCRKKTHLMWAAWIVSIVLDCDFRDAEYELEKLRGDK